ncbi:hypothetical protein E1B28_010992 [Marasmius oreades]|uniref:PARP catalytic domain-containing protein n=1 Tax=Marasmius oreades TaxID=181124 RepID=A0A9P7RT75_9AGAR|nr:uncharacterized protein E1B28_010992 [Marasmius oreades]KAG7089294.1 hypothetical protein E1B28_010992 [Marasmius oreades]
MGIPQTGPAVRDSRRHTPKESTRLIPLKTSNPKYQEIRALFLKGWKHPEKDRPIIQGIYLIVYPSERLEPYRKYRSHVERLNLRSGFDKGSNEQLLFHGTTRLCALGDSNRSIVPCSLSTCSLCCIISKLYDVRKCGSKHKFRRFGTGLYTTSCSSKADDYFHAGGKDSKYRTLLVNRVVVGKPCIRRYNATNLTEPPPGHQSIIGVPGADLNYEETVVYDNNAIHPAFMIAYTNTSEPPLQSKAATLLSTLFKTPVAS